MRGGRVPINLTPQQTEFIIFLLVAIALAIVAGLVLELVIGRGAGLALRATGHKPPRKSYLRMRLEQLDEELDHPKR